MGSQIRQRLTQGTLLLAILLGTLLGPLDAAVNIAFPDITRFFGIEIDAIRWVVVLYVSTYASLMLVFGRVGDLFGHRHVFVAGLIVCVIGYVLCTLADRFALLLGARVIQGIGTAMVLSCGAALATNLFDERLRSRVLGIYVMSFGLGGALGPAVGGILVDRFGWTSAFWARIPLAVLALIIVIALKLPSPKADGGRFSAMASLGTALVMGFVLYVVSQFDTAADRPLRFVLLLGVCILGALIVAFTQRAGTALIAPAHFANFNFVWINVANLVVNLAGFATMLFVPYFLVYVSALSVSLAGLYMGAGAVGMIVGAWAGGHLLRLHSGERLALIATGLVSTGLILMGSWQATTSSAGLLLALVAHGTGLGLFQVSGLQVVTGILPKANRGVAGSLVLVMRTIGVVLATSVLTLVFTAAVSATPGDPESISMLRGFQSTFQAAGIGLGVFLLLSLCRTTLWRKARITP